jgi:alpha-tubulin suppressor-like RCC1 family protein
VIAAAGCAPQPTQIVLVVDTDITSPDPLRRIDIEASSSRAAPLRFDLPLDAASTPELPFTLTLFPQGSPDVDVVVRVRAIDRDDVPIAIRDVRTRFVPGSSRMLYVVLAERCLGVRCAAGETCDETGCRGVAIPGETLPAFTAPPGAIGAGSACVEEPEACNLFDDDCDGTVDEGIDLATDAQNCGRCGHSCTGACAAGYCAGERPVEISAGGAHTCVRREGGTVTCWGWNLAGQLGTSLLDERAAPFDVGLTGATDVAAGGAHTCAVVAMGRVACWGNGAHGELGDGTTIDHAAPAAVTGVMGAAEVTTGNAHTCARIDDGAVCWGLNDQGQLGNGTTASSSTPVPVMGLTGATAVAAGNRHTCAIVGGGAVQCWGAGANGRLGNGMTVSSPVPVPVMALTGATQLALGRRHSCALAMGAVWCWGGNESSQLGDGTTMASSVPVQAMGITDATAIAVPTGGTHTCALRMGGRVTCWGSNLAGQLGDGTTMTRTSPVDVTMLTGATAIAAGGIADDGRGHSCAIDGAGGVVCWGDWELSRLGSGALDDTPTPRPVPGLP